MVHQDGDGLELRGGPGNRMVVAYSDYENLASQCGHGQPWVRIITENLVAEADEERVKWLAIDLPLPEGHRYPEPQRYDEPPVEREPRLPVDDGLCWIASLPFEPYHRYTRPELVYQSSQRRVMLVYTTFEMVQECCGPYQAAFPARIDRLSELAAACDATEVAFDTSLDPAIRHQDVVVN